MNSMLKWIFVLCLTAIAAAQTTAPSPASAPNTSTIDNKWLPPVAPNEDETVRKARAALSQMIQAIGGDAYMNLTSVEQIGLSYSFYNGKPNSLGTDFYRIVKFPDKERSELTKKRDVIYIENGEKGYEVTYKGTTLQDPKTWREYVRRRNFSLEYVLRVWLKAPGTQIYYEGTAIAEQRMADVVSIVNAKNELATLYIEQSSHLPIRKLFTYRDPVDKQKDEEGEIYGNWRMEGSINTPHSIVRTHNGDYTNQRFIKSVTYNAPAPDKLFDAHVTYDPYVLERRLDQQQNPTRQ